SPPRSPARTNCGRLYVPDAAAVPVKVSLSAAYNPTAEPTSATSTMETLDNPFMLPPLTLRLFTGFYFCHALRNPTAVGRPDLPRRTNRLSRRGGALGRNVTRNRHPGPGRLWRVVRPQSAG